MTKRAVHILACGSFAREVDNLNLRSAVLVSGEKVYNRLSEDYQCVSNEIAGLASRIPSSRFGSGAYIVQSVSFGDYRAV